MKLIDLRSDTVTLPSPEMYEAIVSAELGDDVFAEDPTVNALQEKATEITGKEAGLLVPSGTMGNLVSILTHCKRGTEAILGDQSHTFLYECGGISAYGGIHSRQLKNHPDGTMELSDIRKAVRSHDDHFPVTSLICLENTHNRCSGAPLSVDYMNSVSTIAKEKGVKIHVDGARIFNASVALSVPVSILVERAHSITFCMSKGLAAPVGSVICGTKDFISSARRVRKSLGGGMRQAGVIAAAGLRSLNSMVDRIQEDHENARMLAEGLSDIPGIFVDTENVCTNIVFFNMKVDHTFDPVEKMKDEGILFFQTSPGRFRLVTHYGITADDISTALQCFSQLVN